MIDLLVIDGTLHPHENSLPLLDVEIFPGDNTLGLLLKRCSNLKNVKSKVLFTRPSLTARVSNQFNSAGFKVVENGPSHDLQDLLIKLRDQCALVGAQNVALAYIDSPFLDPAVSEAVMKTHLDNKAEYTFPDNFPEGLAVEVLSKEFLDEIIKKKSKAPELLSRRIFDNTDADINQYYAEVWLPDEDISLRRIEFHVNTPRNLALMKRFGAMSGRNPGYAEFVRTITEKSEVLFDFPRYVEIEATNMTNESGAPDPVSLMKRPKGQLSGPTLDSLLKLLDAGYKDIILSFGGIGEPLMNPLLPQLVKTAVEHPGVMSVIVETNAALLTDEIAQSFSSVPPQKLQVIFRLDAINRETAKKLKGLDLERVTANIDKFIALRPENKARSFVQFTKLKENIGEMETFYRAWEHKGVQVIIQKYNSYAGQLPDRKVSDLTPLDRMSCWHLQRDWSVLWNGDVPVCKQDFQGGTLAGNVNKDPADSIMNRIKSVYLDNFRNDFKRYTLCVNCDEWYTYNF